MAQLFLKFSRNVGAVATANLASNKPLHPQLFNPKNEPHPNSSIRKMSPVCDGMPLFHRTNFLKIFPVRKFVLRIKLRAV